ncbi:MAG: hypothetical protein AAB455_01040 [Patescibacteria group bacterium]
MYSKYKHVIGLGIMGILSGLVSTWIYDFIKLHDKTPGPPFFFGLDFVGINFGILTGLYLYIALRPNFGLNKVIRWVCISSIINFFAWYGGMSFSFFGMIAVLSVPAAGAFGAAVLLILMRSLISNPASNLNYRTRGLVIPTALLGAATSLVGLSDLKELTSFRLVPLFWQPIVALGLGLLLSNLIASQKTLSKTSTSALR